MIFTAHNGGGGGAGGFGGGGGGGPADDPSVAHAGGNGGPGGGGGGAPCQRCACCGGALATVTGGNGDLSGDGGGASGRGPAHIRQGGHAHDEQQRRRIVLGNRWSSIRDPQYREPQTRPRFLTTPVRSTDPATIGPVPGRTFKLDAVVGATSSALAKQGSRHGCGCRYERSIRNVSDPRVDRRPRPGPVTHTRAAANRQPRQERIGRRYGRH